MFGASHCTLNEISQGLQSYNFIYGAPPLAPLLFPNLVVLGLLAIWRLRMLAGT